MSDHPPALQAFLDYASDVYARHAEGLRRDMRNDGIAIRIIRGEEVERVDPADFYPQPESGECENHPRILQE